METVDLSLAKPGDKCHLRNGSTEIFRGKDGPEEWPYRTEDFEAYRQDGTWSPHRDDKNPGDIVRVTREGEQISPAVKPSADGCPGFFPQNLDRNYCRNCCCPQADHRAVPSPAESPASGGGELAFPTEFAEQLGKVYEAEAATDIVGHEKRIKHLVELLSEAVAFIETPAPELGSDEWVWLIQAAAAVHNTCVKCSAPCDEEGECVSSDCCFGRSKLAQQSAEGIGSR